MSAGLLVVDASVAVEVLRRSKLGEEVATTMRGAPLAAPAHLDAEVLSALGRLVRAGDATPAAVDHALDRLVRLPIRRYPIAGLVRRAWALRDNIAVRDGLYVACAEMLTATLLTLDARLARSAPVAVKTLPAKGDARPRPWCGGGPGDPITVAGWIVQRFADDLTVAVVCEAGRVRGT